MRIAVGPAPSHWGLDVLDTLYRELAESPVDRVYLGETDCPERSCFSLEVVERLRGELAASGKEVFVSSFVLVRQEAHARSFEVLADRVKQVEINSPAFLGLARRCRAVTGLFLNVCNAAAADVLSRHGVERIVLPCEMPLESISSTAQRCSVAVEVVVHGHVPVGTSRACLTARMLGGNGSGCGRGCRRHPAGIVLDADGQPLFRIDGHRTLSAATHCLVEYLPQLEEAGVDTVRILPQPSHTARIVRIYRDVLDGRRSRRDGLAELEGISVGGLCNGWLLGKGGWMYESPN